MKKFLITRPTHDITVSYLFSWNNNIIKFAKNKNIKFKDFKGKGAIKKNVIKFIEKQEPKFLIFNGHGSPKTIEGHDNEILIKSGENEGLLKSRITYSLSCNSAAELGKKAVEKDKNTSFIGYEGPFSFVKDKYEECRPSQDRFAEPFKKASNEINISILKGKTTGEAYERSQKCFSQLIKDYSTSDVLPESKEIRFWLFWDKFYQKIIGNKNSKF